MSHFKLGNAEKKVLDTISRQGGSALYQSLLETFSTTGKDYQYWPNGKIRKVIPYRNYADIRNRLENLAMKGVIRIERRDAPDCTVFLTHSHF